MKTLKDKRTNTGVTIQQMHTGELRKSVKNVERLLKLLDTK